METPPIDALPQEENGSEITKIIKPSLAENRLLNKNI